jgi:hypothetical protein
VATDDGAVGVGDRLASKADALEKIGPRPHRRCGSSITHQR